jgi:hypothetical protein
LAAIIARLPLIVKPARTSRRDHSAPGGSDTDRRQPVQAWRPLRREAMAVSPEWCDLTVRLDIGIVITCL